MMSIQQIFEKAFHRKHEKNWDKIYIAVDIHDTILKSTYSSTRSTEFFPRAQAALRLISERPDCVLILYTSSLKEDIDWYMDFFKKHGINFKYANENPEVDDTPFSSFKDKLYFNVLLDDKAGFDVRDWDEVLYCFRYIQSQKAVLE